MQIGVRVRCITPNIEFKIGDELVIDKLNLLGYKDTFSAVADKDGISYTLIKSGNRLQHYAYQSNYADFEIIDDA